MIVSEHAAASSPEPRRMTLAEWADLPEDEPGELVDGVLVEEEMPSYLHECVIAALIELLRAWGKSRGAVVAGSGGKFRVSANGGRTPDVTVYLPDARTPELHGLITVPPSIAVEVVSATPRDERRDRVEKLREYAAFGVRWYWLVDPELRTFEVLELGGDGRYAHVVAATEGRVDVPGCDGLVFDVDGMWGELDALAARP